MSRIDTVADDLATTPSLDLATTASALGDAMYLRLMTERGTCWWDPTFGSRLHELRSRGLTESTVARVEDAAREALAPLTSSGELTELSVTVTQAPNRVDLTLSGQDNRRRKIALSLEVIVL